MTVGRAMQTRPRRADGARSASAACSARRTPGSSAARAATSTTSRCPACCTAPSCAARTPTPGSSPSTPAPPRRTPTCRRSSPASSSRALNLAWMPTLSDDVQAVLATDKVRFQGQEVAFVVAEDRYSARDALELIDVEYEPLPPVVDARRALDADAAGHPRRPRGQHRQPHLRLGGRRRRRHRRGVRRRRGRGRPATWSIRGCTRRRWRPAASVADMDTVTGQAHRLGDHARRRTPTARCYALVAGHARAQDPGHLARHRRRVRQQGRHLPRLRAARSSARSSPAAPVKWVEDRSENLMSTAFARDYHMRGEIAATRDGQDPRAARQGARRPRRVQRHRPADEVPGRVLPHLHRLLRPAGRALQASPACYTNKAPGGVAYACSFRVTEAVYLVERMVDVLAFDLGMDPAELRMKNLLRPEQFPYMCADRLGVRLRRLPARRCGWPWSMAGYEELRTEQAEKRRDRRRPLMGIGVSVLHRGGGRRAAQAHGHPRAGHGRRRASCGCTRPARRCSRLSVQTQGQGHETTFAQIVARRARHPGRGHRGRPRRHRPDAVRPRHLRVALDAGLRGGHRGRGPEGAGAGADRRRGDAGGARRTTWSGRRAASRCKGDPARARRSRRSPWPRTPTSSCPTASRATWTRRPSTTRRT